MPVNVLHVVRPMEGGMKEHVLGLLRYHDRKAFRLWIAAPEDLAPDLGTVGVEFLQWNSGDSFHPWRGPHLLGELHEILQRSGASLVHGHGARAGVMARFAARRAGIPALVTGHSFVTGPNLPFWQLLAYRFLERRLYRFTSHYIAVSSALANEICSLGGVPEVKVTTIYNGIDLDRFNSVIDCGQKRRELGLHPSRPVVGMVARLVREKGARFFLRAAAEIARCSPEVQFLLVGDGPERKSLMQEAISLGVWDRMIFAGFLPDVPQVLPVINIILVPSMSEGLSITTLEAMASRRAVIAFKTGGLNEILKDGETGLLVERGDWRGLARATLQLLANNLMTERLGHNARREVERKFTVSRMVRETEGVYRRVLGIENLQWI